MFIDYNELNNKFVFQILQFKSVMLRKTFPKLLFPALIILTTITSCQKDSDLLLETVMYEEGQAEIVLLERGGNGPDPNSSKTADDDGDGVTNDLDECPFTPAGAKVNYQGCAASQYDTDEDGVIDSLDQCPATPAGESVDGNGCANSQKSTAPDDDNDGIPNTNDNCPNTPSGQSVDQNGCAASQKDSDGDGVSNDKDQCANTPSGQNVNGYGCAASQSDGDGDGVTNDRDDCPNTPAGESVNSAGCSTSQRDSDGDGVNDNSDQCPGTPAGESADGNGCANSQKSADPDDDEDGIPNNIDDCPDTPFGESVNNKGCSDSQLNPQSDDDNDGVPNDQDDCPFTPQGATVDNFGCAASQYDTDGDGISDDQDQCPGTAPGEYVDQNGCSTSTGDNDIDDNPYSSELKAFPTAYGAGSYATGGRGGRVINVTTTQDTGSEGSLRWALTQRGPRIVVFKVGGLFELTRGRINLTELHNDLTVAGQTAPGDGVTIAGDYLSMRNVNNIIIRFVRFRGLQNASYKADVITATDCMNIIMDHCSGNWGFDEVWSFTSARNTPGRVTIGNITIQRSLMAEMDPEHSTASLFGTVGGEYQENAGDFSFNNNYVYNISHRFPNALGNGRFEIKNNVIYNWKWRLTYTSYGAQVNQQNNYYQVGPQTLRAAGSESGVMGYLNRVRTDGTPVSIYAGGNLVMPNVITNPAADNSVMWRWFLDGNGKSRNDVVDAELITSVEPSPLGSALPLLSARNAYQSVLNDVGANRSLNANGTYRGNQDSLDEGYIQAALNDSGPSQYRSPEEWTLPAYNDSRNNEPYLDSDNDGMPNVWENAQGLNPNVDDSSGDIDGDGYTNIEEFINSVDY